MANKDYYLGLDCGSASVGWAITDENYNILRAKGHDLHGIHLFEEAKTAAERRTNRSARRRTRRAKTRRKLLQQLFAAEIKKVDPNFYFRLRESRYRSEDKSAKIKNHKNVLFDDPGFTDSDYREKYPTIWHLRKAIIESSDEHFDIRLYFLAIQHILKRRGHFLVSGKMSSDRNFSELFKNLCSQAENFGFSIDEAAEEEVKNLLVKDESKTGKKKELADLMFPERKDDADVNPKARTAFAGLLCGSKVNYATIFNLETEEKMSYSFADNGFEENYLPQIESDLDAGAFELILTAKQIYDWAVVSELLADHDFISEAMVDNYEKHKATLEELKQILKPFREDYEAFFNNKHRGCNYNTYIGKAEESRKMNDAIIDQAAINKQIVKLLDKHGIGGKIKEYASAGKLLPKQRGQAKGTIPQQLHHQELELILKNLARDYPSFAEENPDEPEEYNTACKKIAALHDFRVPYFCGPLVSSDRSQFSWAKEEIPQTVYPWDFKTLAKQGIIDLDARADDFIRRMTNTCTYLPDEDVLPKSSLLYQRFLVLNELNNLRVNGHRFDVKTKQKIFEEVFEEVFVDGQLVGNFRLKTLKKWLIDNSLIKSEDELSGADGNKSLPKLQTHLDFFKILGADYRDKYSLKNLEEVVKAITVLGEEKPMLARRIKKILGCDDEHAKSLSKLSYKEWGRLSAKFLNGITAKVDGVDMTIIEALYNTDNNLMELLKQHSFSEEIESYKRSISPAFDEDIPYKAVADLYCSPAAKRSIWRAILITKELVNILGRPPKRIFIETTRSHEDEKTKNQNAALRLRRKERLLKSYKSIKNSAEAEELMKDLESRKNRNFQGKKLYLYYTQMGHCAYCNGRISPEDLRSKAYDVDHIYPRSLTKDDSDLDNLVLVHASCNREKSNKYPINPDWQKRMRDSWRAWKQAGLINKEKYNRLTRVSELTYDELSGFIARQLVEAGQSAKAIKDLLSCIYPSPKTKIILSKASTVSELRHVLSKGHPEFIKVRSLNDLHHAKDAYLNIVAGNVMYETFTDDPYRYVKQHGGKNYSISPDRIFRSSREYTKQDGQKTTWPEVSGWNFQETIDLVSKNMKKNSVLFTRMTYTGSGPIADTQLSKKSDKKLLPAKQSKKLKDTSRYGGYNSVKGAYFSLIELTDKNDKKTRRLIQVPIIHQEHPDAFIKTAYGDTARVIIPKIPFHSLLKIRKDPEEKTICVHLSGRSKDQLKFWPARQVLFRPETVRYIKRIERINQKLAVDKDYSIDEVHDGITLSRNKKLIKEFTDKLEVFRSYPGIGSKNGEIVAHRSDFENLKINEQCKVFGEFLKIFGCNASKGNLSSFVPRASEVGVIRMPNSISNFDKVILIRQSVTGLRQKEIDLKTVEPE